MSPTGEHIVVHWERYAALDPWEINAIEVGDNGWVAFGNCKVDGVFDEGCTVSVTSTDGETWTEHAIPDGENHTPDHRDMSTAPNGAIVAWMPDGSGGKVGPLVSKDGLTWSPVDQEQFGTETFEIDRVASTPSEVLLSGGSCAGCIEGIWSSTDGRTWMKVAEPAVLKGSVTSFASDGATTIASIGDCPTTYAACRANLWASSHGRPWAPVIEGVNIREARIVVADSGFVAIGDGDPEYAQFASIDGRTWTEVDNDGLPSPYDDERCEIGFITALHDTILMDSAFCGWWRGTVEVAPGAGTPVTP